MAFGYGGFAIAGSNSSSGAGSDGVLVLKLDATGAIPRQKTYGGFDADKAGEIVQLDDGGYAVAGSTNSLTASGHAPWILRLDSSGAQLSSVGAQLAPSAAQVTTICC